MTLRDWQENESTYLAAIDAEIERHEKAKKVKTTELNTFESVARMKVKQEGYKCNFLRQKKFIMIQLLVGKKFICARLRFDTFEADLNRAIAMAHTLDDIQKEGYTYLTVKDAENMNYGEWSE